MHRLLAQLGGYGLVMRVPGHAYTIGARLWELGELSPLSLRLRETALPHMMRLYEATGENVHLAVLDAPTPETATALFVGRLTGQGSIPTLGRMGGRHPLHTTGVVCSWRAAHVDGTWVDVESTHTDLREDASVDGTTRMIMTAIRIATPEQKAHAQKRMQGWIDDFNALAANKK